MFGRSNSLSISTPNSGTSLFGNSQSNTTQPQQQSGGLFGQSTAQPQQSGGLFGASTTASQPQQAGGLFGSSTATSQPQQSGGLFGSSTAASQPQQSGGLFGASTASAQPQQSGGLFGNTNTAQQQQQQPQQSGGLFGASTANNQPQQGGGLFGPAPTSNTGGGLFGQQQQASQPSLFGSTLTQNQPQQNQQQSGGLFGNLGQNNQNQQSNAPSTGLFGGQSNNQQQSLLGSSLMNPAASAARPFAGSLTMGQGNATQPTVPGVKIDISNVRPTTRFGDLHDDLKAQLEYMDKYIRQHESYAADCQALLPVHTANVDSIGPDVDLITSKVETAELALENDGRAIDGTKALVQREATDLMRCARVIQNLALPSQFHYGPAAVAAARSRSNTTPGDDDAEYDVDLVGYFSRQADAMQATLDTYTSNMVEIESHLRVIEASTVHQAQQMAAQRAGGRAINSQDTVRELADTLRGFENGILGAAGLVGSCREGVNELVMGRIGGESRDGMGYGGRRTARF